MSLKIDEVISCTMTLVDTDGLGVIGMLLVNPSYVYIIVASIVAF